MKLRYYQLLFISKMCGMSIKDVKKIVEGASVDDKNEVLFYKSPNYNINNESIMGGDKNDKGMLNSIIQRRKRKRAPIYCGKNRNVRFSKTRGNC